MKGPRGVGGFVVDGRGVRRLTDEAYKNDPIPLRLLAVDEVLTCP